MYIFNLGGIKMAIKPMDYNSDIRREVKREIVIGETASRTVTDTYYRTQFIADGTEDITAMNAEGSTYLNYPAGSAVLCIGDGNVYVLNASETEYEVLGGAEE